MKALILIELDDAHLLKEANTIYDRLKGYKCELKNLPERKTPNGSDLFNDYVWGWNACLEEITGDKECYSKRKQR